MCAVGTKTPVRPYSFPARRRCNSGRDQLLQHSHTPSLRAARFEDEEDDEDENEAFCDLIDQTK
jgi:hypothetical protein